MKIDVNLFNEDFQTHQLDGAKVHVGRSSQCDVVINHESMSRKHCLIEIEDGKIFVTDLGSTNGVTIDGNRIEVNQKTFYLNSLPLMIGAASITIDLTDHRTRTHHNILLQPEESKPVPPVASVTKTSATQKFSRDSTRSLDYKTRANKNKTAVPEKKAVSKNQMKPKEIIIAVISVLVFAAMALWHFSQE